ncbi:MAG: AAA family ATPase [Pseudomonadota bacterium]
MTARAHANGPPALRTFAPETEALVGPASVEAQPNTTRKQRKGPHLFSYAEAVRYPQEPYLIKHLIARGDYVAVLGDPGTGKSTWTARLAHALARGASFFGRRTRAAKVLYVAAEDSTGVRRRLCALDKLYGPAPNLKLATDIGDLKDPKCEDRMMLRALIRREKPDLVILDTLAMAFAGMDENSSEGMGSVNAFYAEVAKEGAALMLVHHPAKNGSNTPRGHSSLHGALYTSIFMKKADGGVVEWSPIKNRNGQPFGRYYFKIETVDDSVDEDGDAIKLPYVEELDEESAPKRSGKLTARLSAAFGIVHTELKRREKVGGAPLTRSDAVELLLDGGSVSGASTEANRRRGCSDAIVALVQKHRLAQTDDVLMLGSAADELRNDPE